MGLAVAAWPVVVVSVCKEFCLPFGENLPVVFGGLGSRQPVSNGDTATDSTDTGS